MKTLIKRFSTTALIATIFTACGGGGSDASFSNGAITTKTTKINLTIGTSVVVNPGDKVSAQNDETQIKIEHILGKEIKSVTLLKGEATLIYGDYTLNNS